MKYKNTAYQVYDKWNITILKTYKSQHCGELSDNLICISISNINIILKTLYIVFFNSNPPSNMVIQKQFGCILLIWNIFVGLLNVTMCYKVIRHYGKSHNSKISLLLMTTRNWLQKNTKTPFHPFTNRYRKRNKQIHKKSK